MIPSYTSELRKKIADFDRCYTLVVQNTNPFPVSVTLFGAKQFLTAINFGLPAGVIVNVIESSYQELLQETIYRPFVVGGMTIQSTIPQLVQITLIRYRDTNGVINQYVFHPFNYFSVNQYANDFLEIYPVKIEVTGESQSQFNLLAGSTVTTVLYICKRINMTNFLCDQPIEEIGSDLYPLFKSEIVV